MLPSYQNIIAKPKMKPLAAYGYYGGKTRYAEQIAGLLDYNTSTYVEPFGGGAAVLLNKPPHKCEIYFEKSLVLCSFWRCMADKAAAIRLIERLYDTDYDEDSFNSFVSAVNEIEASGRHLNDLTDNEAIDIAAACFVLHSMSRDSAGLRFRTDRIKGQEAYLRSVDRLIEVADRFNNVEVIHSDVLDLLSGDRFNNPDVMLYFDPVYLSAENHKHTRNQTLYRYAFSYAEHCRLLEHIRSMKSIIIISGYDDDTKLYDRYLIDGEGVACGDNFRPWQRYEIESVSSVARGDKNRTEVLWSNYT